MVWYSGGGSSDMDSLIQAVGREVGRSPSFLCQACDAKTHEALGARGKMGWAFGFVANSFLAKRMFYSFFFSSSTAPPRSATRVSE